MFKIRKTVTDKTTDGVIEDSVVQKINHRDPAVFSMGFLLGKVIKDNPEYNIIRADCNDVLISAGDRFIRYQLTEGDGDRP